jgi:hypothetical protein
MRSGGLLRRKGISNRRTKKCRMMKWLKTACGSTLMVSQRPILTLIKKDGIAAIFKGDL